MSVFGTALGFGSIIIRPETSAFGAQLASQVTKGVDEAQAKIDTQTSGLADLGQKMALPLIGGFALAAAAAVKLADDYDTVHARLANAISDTNTSVASMAPAVAAVDAKFAAFGENQTSVENALARLTQIVHNPETALKDLGLAEDIVRGRGMSLLDATTLLGRGLDGNYTSLLRLGVITKDQVKDIHTQDDLLRLLAATYGGAAKAQADTFAGSLRALKANAQDLGIAFGNDLIPVIQTAAHVASDAAQFFEHNRGAAEALALVVGGPLVAALGAYAARAALAAGAGIAEMATKAATAMGLLTPVVAAETAAESAQAGGMAALAAGIAETNAQLALLTGVETAAVPETEALGAAAAATGGEFVGMGAASSTLLATLGPLGAAIGATILVEQRLNSETAKFKDAALQGESGVASLQQQLADLEAQQKKVDSSWFVKLFGVPGAQPSWQQSPFSRLASDLDGALGGSVAKAKALQEAIKSVQQQIAALNGTKVNPVVAAAQQEVAAGEASLAQQAQAYLGVLQNEAAGTAVTSQATQNFETSLAALSKTLDTVIAQEGGQATAAQEALKGTLADLTQSTQNYDTQLQKLQSDQDAVTAATDRLTSAQDALATEAQRVSDVRNHAGQYALDVAHATDTLAQAQITQATDAQKLAAEQAYLNGVYHDTGQYALDLEKAQSAAAKAAISVQSALFGQVDATNALTDAENALLNLQQVSAASQQTLSEAGGNVNLARELAMIQAGSAAQNAKALATAQENVGKAKLAVQSAALAVTDANLNEADAQQKLSALVREAIPGTVEYGTDQLNLRSAQQALQSATLAVSEDQQKLTALVNEAIPGTKEYQKDSDALAKAQAAVATASDAVNKAQAAWLAQVPVVKQALQDEIDLTNQLTAAQNNQAASALAQLRADTGVIGPSGPLTPSWGARVGTAVGNAAAASVTGAINNPTDWAIAFLKALGDPTTAANVKSVVGWEARESPWSQDQRSRNPLNTTQPEPGATNVNSVGVKAYATWAQGIQANVTAIENGRYADLLAALASGGGFPGSYRGLSTWSGGGYSSIPSFDVGGVVPGPKGSPLLAIVHGGEMVVPDTVTAAGPGRAGSFSSATGGSRSVTVNIPVTVNMPVTGNVDPLTAESLRQQIRTQVDEGMVEMGQAILTAMGQIGS